MPFRSDLSIDFTVSPRIILIQSPSTTLTVQDLYDTIATLQAQSKNMPFKHVVDPAGKADLGGGILTGVVLTLRNARVKFEDRAGPSLTRTTVTGGTVVAVDTDGVTPIDVVELSANIFTEAFQQQNGVFILVDGGGRLV